jgi:hypothetical protein
MYERSVHEFWYIGKRPERRETGSEREHTYRQRLEAPAKSLKDTGPTPIRETASSAEKQQAYSRNSRHTQV